MCKKVALKVRGMVTRGLRARTGIQAVEARLSFFDLHLFLGVLSKPLREQPKTEPWSWLRDRKQFDALGALADGPTQPEGAHFTWRALQARGGQEKEGSKFWSKFCGIPLNGAGKEGSYHDHLLPLVCEPIESAMRFEWKSPFAVAPFACEPRLTIYLWPFGWSTRVDIDLHGEIGLRDLADISAAVRSDALRPLHFEGQRLTLPLVLKVINERFAQDLLGSDAQAAVRYVDGCAMVSVLDVLPEREGIALPDCYTFNDQGHHASCGRLVSEEDRHRILAIIAGTPADDFRKLDAGVAAYPVDLETGFAVVGMSGGSFIPTRTFALLANPREISSRRCGAANIEISAQVYTAIRLFLEKAHMLEKNHGKRPPGARRLARLADCAEQVVSQWPYFYPRRVFKAIARAEGGASPPSRADRA